VVGNIVKKILLLFAILSAAIGSAQAADLAVKAPVVDFTNKLSAIVEGL
jgi:hypothetical protein